MERRLAQCGLTNSDIDSDDEDFRVEEAQGSSDQDRSPASVSDNAESWECKVDLYKSLPKTDAVDTLIEQYAEAAKEEGYQLYLHSWEQGTKENPPRLTLRCRMFNTNSSREKKKGEGQRQRSSMKSNCPVRFNLSKVSASAESGTTTYYSLGENIGFSHSNIH